MAIKKTLYLEEEEEEKHNTDWTGQSNESNGDRYAAKIYEREKYHLSKENPPD